jgi:hypothetical protein
MGYGTWSRSDFESYSAKKGRATVNGVVSGNYSSQEMFASRSVEPELNPKNVIRECVDSEEHPNSIPVIIGLDVTGSMGAGGVAVAKSISKIIEDLYTKYKDIEFMIMGIGDLSYDNGPIQISQFESDIRIADQLDKVWFEHGGGGNGFESYTAAWYMGLNHTKLDCWNRGKKGIIITTGDEPLNPYLPFRALSRVTGDGLEADVETKELFNKASEKFDIFHIAVDDSSTSYDRYKTKIDNTFGQLLGERLKVANLDNLASKVVECIDDALAGTSTPTNNNYISW